MAPPKTSVDCTVNFAEFASWFTTDADCLWWLHKQMAAMASFREGDSG
jgi:hypothetical protein